MNKQIESGTEYLESIEDLMLDLDKIEFQDVLSISNKKISKTKVYDLEIKDNHNYHVNGLGIVHNGGGRL